MTLGFESDKYAQYANLTPVVVETEVSDGVETLCVTIQENSVLFVDFTAKNGREERV